MQCGGHQRTINLPILQTTGAFVVLSRAACQLSISHFANSSIRWRHSLAIRGRSLTTLNQILTFGGARFGASSPECWSPEYLIPNLQPSTNTADKDKTKVKVSKNWNDVFLKSFRFLLTFIFHTNYNNFLKDHTEHRKLSCSNDVQPLWKAAAICDDIQCPQPRFQPQALLHYFEA